MTQATHGCNGADGTPCDLCKQRAMYADIFVAVTEDGRSDTPPGTSLDAYVCGHCIPTHNPPIDVSLDAVQVWEVGSDGWLGPIGCMDCGEPIEVEVDDNEPLDEVTEVIPDMEARVRAMHDGHTG